MKLLLYVISCVRHIHNKNMTARLLTVITRYTPTVQTRAHEIMGRDEGKRFKFR